MNPFYTEILLYSHYVDLLICQLLPGDTESNKKGKNIPLVCDLNMLVFRIRDFQNYNNRESSLLRWRRAPWPHCELTPQFADISNNGVLVLLGMLSAPQIKKG